MCDRGGVGGGGMGVLLGGRARLQRSLLKTGPEWLAVVLIFLKPELGDIPNWPVCLPLVN